MTPTDCVNLIRLINARCPSMRLDDATPDAWYIDLRAVDVTDAREAVITLSRRQAYIALHELLTEAATIERRRAGRQRVAEIEAQIERDNAGELHDRPVAALTVGQQVPSAADLMRAEVARQRRTPDFEAATQVDAERQTQREQAAAEVEAVRQKQAGGNDQA